jgi:hypothetical protein
MAVKALYVRPDGEMVSSSDLSTAEKEQVAAATGATVEYTPVHYLLDPILEPNKVPTHLKGIDLKLGELSSGVDYLSDQDIIFANTFNLHGTLLDSLQDQIDALEIDASDADTLNGQPGSFYLAWANITGKPATFTPSAHTHAAADIISGIFDPARLGTNSGSAETLLNGVGDFVSSVSGGFSFGDDTIAPFFGSNVFHAGYLSVALTEAEHFGWEADPDTFIWNNNDSIMLKVGGSNIASFTAGSMSLLVGSNAQLGMAGHYVEIVGTLNAYTFGMSLNDATGVAYLSTDAALQLTASEILFGGSPTFSSLAGLGTRFVTADAAGNLGSTATISSGSITGLGTMSSQNASAVAITGGSALFTTGLGINTNNIYFTGRTSGGTAVSLFGVTNDATNLFRFRAAVDAGGFQWTNQAASVTWMSLLSTGLSVVGNVDSTGSSGFTNTVGGIVTRALSHSGDSRGYFGTATNHNVGLLRNGAMIFEAQSTGVKTYGTYTQSGSTVVIENQATGGATYRGQNTGGVFYLGLDSSVGGLGGAYTLNMWHSGNYALVFATNNVAVGSWTHAGGLTVNNGLGVYDAAGQQAIFNGWAYVGANPSNGEIVIGDNTYGLRFASIPSVLGYNYIDHMWNSGGARTIFRMRINGTPVIAAAMAEWGMMVGNTSERSSIGSGADTLSVAGSIGLSGLQFNANYAGNFEFVHRGAGGFHFYVNSGTALPVMFGRFTPTNTLVTDAAGVSIGTSTVNSKLTVAGTMVSSPTTGAYGIVDIINSAIPNQALSLGVFTSVYGTIPVGTGVIQSVHRASAYKDLVIQPLGGNVGIGLGSAPPNGTYNLHVGGHIATNQYVFGAYANFTADVATAVPTWIWITHSSDNYLRKQTPAQFLTNVGITSGQYTPTYTNSANVAAFTHITAFYQRVGNIVFVQGHMHVDPTSTSTSTSWLISLPVASAITATTQVAGSFQTANTTFGNIIGHIVGDAAHCTYFATSDAVTPVYYSFTYIIV